MEKILKKIAEFIDEVRESLGNTKDAAERTKRLEIFDSLLLLATCSSAIEFEKVLLRSLPLEESSQALIHLCEQLREINGLCTFSFSDRHEIYQPLFANIQFNNFDEKDRLRQELGRQLTELIFEKTDTEIPSNSFRL